MNRFGRASAHVRRNCNAHLVLALAASTACGPGAIDGVANAPTSAPTVAEPAPAPTVPPPAVQSPAPTGPPPIVLVTDPASLAAFGDRLEFAELLFDDPGANTLALRQHASYRSLADHTDTDLEVATDPPAAKFRRYWLASKDTHFVLVGIVNRLDRRDVLPGTCGETRLIYRLASRGRGPAQRLPLSYNVIFEQPDDGQGCREVARSWMVEAPLALAEPGHPLHPTRLQRDLLRHVEFNVRSVEEGPNAAAVNALGVLRYDAASGRFEPERLEFEPVPWKGRLDRPRKRAEVLPPAIVEAALDG
ncbi:MAG: hypothetical protein AAF721_36185, partial [Myxococcota bacterium]